MLIKRDKRFICKCANVLGNLFLTLQTLVRLAYVYRTICLLVCIGRSYMHVFREMDNLLSSVC